MRTIDRATAFKRDYRRVKADSRHTRNIDALLVDVLALLAADRPCPKEIATMPWAANGRDIATAISSRTCC
jgi:hypothetical protein